MKSTSTIQVASCQFHQFGSAGLQQSLNALCILTHNIIVDKVNIIIIIIKLHIFEVNNLSTYFFKIKWLLQIVYNLVSSINERLVAVSNSNYF